MPTAINLPCMYYSYELNLTFPQVSFSDHFHQEGKCQPQEIADDNISCVNYTLYSLLARERDKEFVRF